MKYCPVCELRFDEEIIKFCTKDGTPLIEEATPSFTTMPSEALDDDFGQDTVIRRRDEVVPPTQQSERIVIPTEIPQMEQQVRSRVSQAYYPPPPPEANSTKTIVLTILGTLAAVGFGALLFWALQGEQPVANNINMNPPNANTNLNSNIGFDSNFNFNTNANFNTNTNFNINTNLNANMRSPSPTQTPKPSPSPTSTQRETATPTGTASPRPTIDRPPTPAITPRPPANRPANNGT